MTIRAMNWAWGVDLPPAMKLVLLKLADRANDDGECWPGMEVVAEACGVSVRSVMRYVKQMEEMGLLRVDRRIGEDGRRLTNVYWMNFEWSPSDNLSHGPCDNGSTNHVTTVSPDKELKLFIETTVETTDATTKVAAPDPHPEPEPIVQAPVTWDGVRFTVDDAVYDQWVAAYANGRTANDTEDWIEAELAKASMWLQSNPRKRKKNLLRFLTGWLTRSADSMRQRAYPQQPRRPYH